MNIIHLCGGLGNQLFQYAFGRVQSEFGIHVHYNIDWFARQDVQRHYILDRFNIDVPIGSAPGKRIRESGFDLSLLQKDGFNFHGYWQYPAYYDCILPILRKEFRVKEGYYTAQFIKLREEITASDSIAVHVRRGDYLQLLDFPVLSMKYYSNALKKVSGQVYVFSDDIEWCRRHFEGVKFIHLTEYLDFELMRLCKHNIISRSSFSWWAAHLNSNPSKIVVVPKQQIECKARQRAKNRAQEVFDPKEWVIC
jgi:hypothetical protein